jgi:hypothetical protein
MRRSTVLLLIALALAASTAACGWRSSGYANDFPEEDWGNYDYVLRGPAPIAHYPKTVVELNVNDDGTVDGVVSSIIWSQFTGALSGETLTLNLAFSDPACAGESHGEFCGQFTGKTLAGTFEIQSCQWYSFAFDGGLVGGRDWTPADGEGTP